MAYRAPFKLSGSDLQVMNTSDITAIQSQAIYAYSLSPSVTLSVVGSNGNLNAMTDRRYAAGAASLSNTGFAGNSADIAAVDTTWDVIDQTIASTANTWDDSNVNIAYPVYLTAAGEIQAMSREDFYDTFIDPAITAWYAPTGNGNFAGAAQYAVYEGNGGVNGFTLVSNSPVFQNTVSADTIRSGALPENPLDQPSATTTDYYLYLKNASAVTHELPFKIDSDGNIQQYTQATFNNMLQYHMRHAITSRAGSYIRYQVQDASGTLGRNSGTGMADTHYASFTRRTYQTGDNYYTQEVPSGSLTTRSTYYLKIVNSNDITSASASYTASASATSIDEGESVTFNLTTNNVADGTVVAYTISGITADDLTSGSLSGNVTINSNAASVTISLAEDGTTENEVATCTFTTASGNRTASVSIGDVAPVGPWPSSIPFAWGTEFREIFGASQGGQAQAFSRVTFYNQVGSQNRIQVTSVSGTNAAVATPANGYIELGDTYAGATIEVRYRITNASYNNAGSTPSEASGTWVTVADGSAKQFNWLADAILQGQATNDVSTIDANTVDFEVRISKSGQDTVIRTSPVKSLSLRARVSAGEIE